VLDKDHPFPVAEVGLGQVGVLRGEPLAFDQHGAALQKAARLLRQRLDPTASQRPAKKRQSLRRRATGDMLEA
jgi:hypothetical protein